MNQKGISLVQTVIAGAMAAGIGLYIAKMSQTASRSAETFRKKIAIEFMKKDIRDIMQRNENCSATLTNAGTASAVAQANYSNIVPGHAVERISYTDSDNNVQPLYEKGISYEGVEITDITVTDKEYDAAAAVGDANVLFLRIQFDKDRGTQNTFGASQTYFTVRLYVERDSSGDFTTCASDAAYDIKRDICNGLGASFKEDGTCDIIGIVGAIGCPANRAFRGIQINTVLDIPPGVPAWGTQKNKGAYTAICSSNDTTGISEGYGQLISP